jgi:ribokinase
MYDMITVGSATMDAFAKTDAELITIRSGSGEEEHIAYPVGTKILVEHLDFQTGGGGTNTAVSFSRLGLKTAFLGKIGKDANGRQILEELKRERVEFIGALGKEQTGYSIILDSIEEDRTILAFKGANNSLSSREIKKSRLTTRWFYFSSMMEKSYTALEYLASHAARNSIKIAFNPSSYLTKKGVAYLSKVLRSTYVLILNKEEAEMLVGRGTMDELAISLRKLGPKIAVVTNGRDGVTACDGMRLYHLQANKVKVAETTGAGDAYASGFVAGMALGKSVEFSMRLGMVNATSVVMYIGAKNRLLTMREALKMIARNPHVKVSKCSRA